MSTEFKIALNGDHPDWLTPGDGSTSGIKLSNIGGRGVNFELTTPIGSAINSSAVMDEDAHGIPKDVWRRWWATPSFGTFEGKFTGLAPGEAGELPFFGVNGRPDRPRKLHVNGEIFYHYETGVQGETPGVPDAPTVAPFVADANGEVSLLFDYESANASYAGMILKLDLTAELGLVKETAYHGETVPIKMIRAGDSGNTISSVVLSDGVQTTTQTINSQTYNATTDETTADILINQGHLPFNGNYTLTVTMADASTYSTDIEVIPAQENQFDLVYDAVTTEGSVFHGASATPADSSQVEWSDYPNTIVQSNGMVFQTEIRSFDVRVWDITDSTWSAWATVTPLEGDGGDTTDPDEPSEPTTPLVIYRGRGRVRKLAQNATEDIVGSWITVSASKAYGFVVQGEFGGATVRFEEGIIDTDDSTVVLAQDTSLSFTADSGLVTKKIPEGIRVRPIIENSGVNTNVSIYLTV